MRQQALRRLAEVAGVRLRWMHPHISVRRFVSKGLVGASPVVCFCIAVIGLGPAACNRAAETTGGATHDVRGDHRCLNAAEGCPRPSA